MKVSEIRQKLVESGQYTEEQAAEIKGKQNLLDALESVEENVFNDLGNQAVETTEEVEQDTPAMSPQELVFSRLREDELIDGNPTCAGLRRVAQEIIGKIVSSRVVDFVAPKTDERAGRATVVYEIVIEDMRGLDYTDVHNPPIIVMSDIADCWWGNAGDNKYAVHPSATASTRAEGRCLRKLLNLNSITAEENSNIDEDEVMTETDYGDDFIQSHVKILVKSRCEGLGIDVLKLIQSVFGDKYVAIDQMSREDGGQLVKLVNEYQQGTEIPDDIKDSNF